MTTLKIEYTILDGNCGDLNESEIEQYANELEAAIMTAYPGAEIDMNIRWNTSGSGGGASVRETDGEYEVGPDDAVWDCEAIETNIGDIAERVFEVTGRAA